MPGLAGSVWGGKREVSGSWPKGRNTEESRGEMWVHILDLHMPWVIGQLPISESQMFWGGVPTLVSDNGPGQDVDEPGT